MGPLAIPVIGVVPPGSELWFAVADAAPMAAPHLLPDTLPAGSWNEPLLGGFPAVDPAPLPAPVLPEPVLPEPVLPEPVAPAPATTPPPAEAAADPPAQFPSASPSAERPPAQQPPAEQPPRGEPSGEEPPTEQPPAEELPAEELPAEPPPTGEPPVQQPLVEEPPAEEAPAVPDESALTVGQPLQVRDPSTGELVLTVMVEEVTADVTCTDPAVVAVHGHLVELRLTVTTGADLSALGAERSVVPADFVHVADDGTVTGDGTAAAGCTTGSELFPGEPLAHRMQLTGAVVLDLPAVTGAVGYRPEWLTSWATWQLESADD